MWVIIHMARGIASARAIEEALAAEGLLVRFRALYKGRSDEGNYYEISVPAAEAEEARELLAEKGLLI